MKRIEGSDITKWDIEKVKSFKKEYQLYTNEQINNLIESIDKFARILFPILKTSAKWKT